MAAAKWFDLLDHNSKLERHGTGHGQYTLHLELDADRVKNIEDEDMLDLGWVLDKTASPIVGRDGRSRVKLENLRPMVSAAEVGQSLALFFSNDELKGSYTTQDVMRQGERLDGLQERTRIGESELLEVIRSVTPENQSRIRSAVERACEAVERRRARVSAIPFMGQGKAMFDMLTPAVAEVGKVPDDVAGRFVATVMGEVARTDAAKPSALREHMNNMADALLQRDEGQLQAEGEWLAAAMAERAIEWASRVRATVQPEDDETPDDAFARTARLAAWGWSSNGLIEAQEAGALVDFVFEREWEANGLTGESAVNTRFALSDRMTLDTIARRLPFKVKGDNSIPSQQMANHLAAIERAMQFVGSTLGRAPDALVPDQRSVPMRFAFGDLTTDSATKGMMLAARGKDAAPVKEAAVEGEDRPEDRAGLSIGVSVKAPYTFIHELGHLIDYGNSFSDSERRSIIEASGASADIEGRVLTEYGRDSDHATYLLSDQEVFARLFAASIRDACIDAGDPKQGLIGGWLTNHYWHEYAGVTVDGSSERFLSALREVLDSRRELNMANRSQNDEDHDNAMDYQSDAEPAPSRVGAIAPGG